MKSPTGLLLERVRRAVMRDSAASVGLTIVASLLSMASAIVFARTMGAEPYGVYLYAVTWLTLLVTPATLGMQPVTVREAAKQQGEGNVERLRGTWWWSARAALIASLAIVTLTALVALAIGGGSLEDPVILVLCGGLALIPLMAIARVASGILRGLRHVVAAQVPESLVQPSALLVLTGACIVFWPATMGPLTAMALSVAAALVALVVTFGLLARRLPTASGRVDPLPAERRLWMQSGLTFVLMAGLQLLSSRVPVLVLGFLDTPSSVSLFHVANRAAGLTTLFVPAVGLALSPIVAEYHAARRVNELQTLVRDATWLCILAATVLGIVLVVLGPWMLSLFGAEFAAAYVPLLILLVGQLFNAVTGPAGVVVNMTGHERVSTIALGLGTVLNVMLCVVLIPPLGAEGAAIAASTSLAAWNIALVVYARRVVGVDPSILSRGRAEPVPPKLDAETARKTGRLTQPIAFLLGAPKSATTALAECLSAHPEITVSSPKEAPYFLAEFDKGLDYYLERYFRGRSPGGLLCDVGPGLYPPWVPERIEQVAPHARFLVILRDPVERAYSHWWHRASRGWEPLPFEEAIADEQRQRYGERLGEPEQRDLFCRQVMELGYARDFRLYIHIGQYATHLRRYVDRFGIERLKVMFAEELVTDPDMAMASIFGFLEVAPMPGLVPERVNEAQSAVYHRTLSAMARATRFLRVPRVVTAPARRLIEVTLSPLTRALPGARPSRVDPQLRSELSAYFRPYNEELARLLELPALPWDAVEESAAGGPAGDPRGAADEVA